MNKKQIQSAGRVAFEAYNTTCNWRSLSKEDRIKWHRVALAVARNCLGKQFDEEDQELAAMPPMTLKGECEDECD